MALNKFSALGYHATFSEFEPGKVYEASSSEAGSSGNSRHSKGPLFEAETILERVRQENYKDKPSRLGAFFSYPYERTPWENRGFGKSNLYEVEPTGSVL